MQKLNSEQPSKQQMQSELELYKTGGIIKTDYATSYNIYASLKIALDIAKDAQARVEADHTAALETYDAAHGRLRTIQLKEREIKQALAAGKTIEAYRAEMQPIKDTLISYTKKLVYMMDHSYDSDDEDETWEDITAAALDYIKDKHMLDRRVVYYLTEGIKCDSRKKLQTFINRMSYQAI